MFPVPVWGWALQRWTTWDLGRFQSVSPMSCLAIMSGKIRDYCIHRENLQKQAFSREFSSLTSKKSFQVVFRSNVSLKIWILASLSTWNTVCAFTYTLMYVFTQRHENISTQKCSVAFHFILNFFNRPVQASNPFDCVSFQKQKLSVNREESWHQNNINSVFPKSKDVLSCRNNDTLVVKV